MYATLKKPYNVISFKLYKLQFGAGNVYCEVLIVNVNKLYIYYINEWFAVDRAFDLVH